VEEDELETKWDEDEDIQKLESSAKKAWKKTFSEVGVAIRGQVNPLGVKLRR